MTTFFMWLDPSDRPQMQETIPKLLKNVAFWEHVMMNIYLLYTQSSALRTNRQV